MRNIKSTDMPKFKRLYKEAKDNDKTEFKFKGATVLVSYAKYVIEYFDSMKPKAKK